ncbi:biosynthetic arginine decarboxylase [Bacterioplanes sanyensis]|uniref:biosynthetic arginine decarboxylase n=1 Tax=Bacterioplanes sanyensis TaxID=1249553 RepID=UPI001679B674|nr:biosynthetic arginine decarboxylase [Bacterioplanes sanyensis]GGY53180.1 biosynthetic arginine decarboxylase [Bacterioplanes sanyensis]
MSEAVQDYNLPYWSDGYVSVNADGQLCVRPQPQQPPVVLQQVIHQAQQQGLRLPLLVRFPGIIHHRVQTLVDAFAEARNELGYDGPFVPVYPIKVNQQQPVVAEVVQGQRLAGCERVGLEAGSKPELIAVLSQLGEQPGLIVCNGYKDRHFIRLALLAEKLGHQVFLVIEKLSELPLILAQAKELGVSPRLGIRARLATIGKGNWQNTGGEKSKFGLAADQMLAVVQQLQQQGQLACLQLLHFHLGSQLANIRDIHTGLRECSRLFAELVRLQVPIQWLDVGGGLGVDYEGTRSRSYCSMNYSVTEYARNVVSAFADVCRELDVPMPGLITESGRAMTAHHAVLVAQVIDHESPAAETPEAPAAEAPTELQHLYTAWQQLQQELSPRSLVELYHDVQHWMSDAQTAFSHGLYRLHERAQAEALYRSVGLLLKQRLNPSNRSHRPLLDELHEKLADKVFVNFSLFQSLPDIWGIDQIFPVVPLARLNQPATARGVLQDITCDSDGRIDQYVDADGIAASLPLPGIERGDCLGFFMVGAYQEILGDLHNLFGDTDSVVVDSQQGEIRLQHAQHGDDLQTVLAYVNYAADDIRERLQQQVASSALPEGDHQQLFAELSEALTAYTYLGE